MSTHHPEQDSETPLGFGEIVRAPAMPGLGSDAFWQGARLVADAAEVVRRIQVASTGYRDLSRLLSAVEGRIAVEDDVDRLLSLTRWLLTRQVQGPGVRTTLHQLVTGEFRRLAGRSSEETDRDVATLAERLRRLPVATAGGTGATPLGSLLPPDYVLRKGSSEQTLRLAAPPARAMDLADPVQEIRLLAEERGEGSDPKGCGPCKQDPSSSLGGTQFCIRPGFEGLVECRWPPPPPPPVPEPTWEYLIQVGNSWWTTFVGVWHGSAWTRTVKKISTSSTTVPWTVPDISACVGYAQQSWIPEDDYCFNISCVPQDYCTDCNTASASHDVSVSITDAALYGSPWGVNSKHQAAGRTALYCDGRWQWS